MNRHGKVVHVIGTGTIGEPLIALLADYRDALGIDDVTFHKRTPLETERPKCINLARRGARLCVDAEARKGFQALGIEPVYETREALERASVVIDCTPSGVGTENKKKYYEAYKDNTIGFIAQGSEFGFGKMYARGINDSALKVGEDMYIHVVSCNTHNLAVLLQTFALAAGTDNLEEARFVCMRRANDLSQDTDFVASPEVGKHKDKQFGTHHARDAYHLFNTLGLDLNIFSSALLLNTQYMHAIWFDIRVKRPVTVEQLLTRCRENDRIALTKKLSMNLVFSFGRDYGHYGRILNQTVIVDPTLTVQNNREIVGFCYTPQDGNSILSSIAAAAWFLDPKTYEEKIQCLKPHFFPEV